jgi:hypothetical protein
MRSALSGNAREEEGTRLASNDWARGLPGKPNAMKLFPAVKHFIFENEVLRHDNIHTQQASTQTPDSRKPTNSRLREEHSHP